MPLVPHSLCFIKNGNVLDFCRAFPCCAGYFCWVKLNLSVPDGDFELAEHIVAVAMDDLYEAANLPFGFGFSAFLPIAPFLLHFVSRKGLGEDFYEWTVTGKVNRQIPFFLLNCYVEAH